MAKQLLKERFQELAGIKPLSLNEEDRATRVDKMMSGEYEDEDYKDSKRYDDVRADLEREMGRGDKGSKYDKQSLVNTLSAETTQIFMNITEEVADATGADRDEVYDFVQKQLFPAYHEAAALLIRAYEETSARSIENFK